MSCRRLPCESPRLTDGLAPSCHERPPTGLWRRAGPSTQNWALCAGYLGGCGVGGGRAPAEGGVSGAAESGQTRGVGLRSGVLPLDPTPHLRTSAGEPAKACFKGTGAAGALCAAVRLPADDTTGGLSLPLRLCYPARVDPTPCGCRALESPNPMLRAYRLLYPASPHTTPQLWEWQQPASVNQQAVRGSHDVVCTRAVQSPLTLL